VILTVVTGGLPRWLLDDGELNNPTDADATLRALVPVSMHRYHDRAGNLSVYLVDLPASEPAPPHLLVRVRDTMRRHKAAGPSSGPARVRTHRSPSARLSSVAESAHCRMAFASGSSSWTSTASEAVSFTSATGYASDQRPSDACRPQGRESADPG